MSINAIKKSTHKLIVDVLQEDGVLCNSGTKTYDESETFKSGGKGLRHSFHHLNNTINLYHNFLKILTGDERANVYESIPVIDFLDTDNTSLLNHYTFNEDGSLNTTSIQSIPVNTTAEILAGTAKQSIDYILNDDPYTINRAVMGDIVAEQFFNTTEAISNDLNIVTVSSPDREIGLCYKGILSREMFSTEGVPFQYTKSSPAFTYEVSSSLQLEVDWDDSTSLLANILVDENNTSISYREYFVGDELLADTNAKRSKVFLPNTKSSFISNVSQDRYKVCLTRGDICVILPKVAYSLDPTKVIIFKKEESSITPYVLYIRDYTSSRELDIINPEDNFPSYITESYLNVLSCYANIEKEYYADASGLMNGSFCEPKYTENAPTGRKVTKWKFLNDADKASAKSRIIPVGSKYYENHLLYRGSFKEEPLACRDTLVVDGESKSFKGMASFLYEQLKANAKNMLGKGFFVEDIEAWENYYLTKNPTTLDFVITEEVLANPDKFALKDKIKNLDGTSVTYDDVADLLDNVIGVIEGTTLRVDTSESFVCRELRESRDAKAADWWDKLFADTSNLLENTSDNFDNSFETFIKIKYFRHKDCKKVGKLFNKTKVYEVDEYFGGFSLEGILSPLDILNHKLNNSTENDTLLLWPSSHSAIPERLILLSRNPLGLESEDLLVFYNGNSNDGKFIGFQINSVKDFKPSTIKEVYITDHTEDPEAPDQNPSKTIPVEAIQGHDCYIYYLKNYSLNTEGIYYNNHLGKRVKLSDTFAGVPLTPLAYPYSYFKGEYSIDSLTKEPIYSIDRNHYNDVYGLQGSFLIKRLPDVGNFSEITIGPKEGPAVSLWVIGNYIKDLKDITEIASQKALYKVLYDWPLTDSEENPITLGNFCSVVKGLNDSSDILKEVADLEIFNNSEDPEDSYIKNSLNNLLYRLSNSDNNHANYLDFTNVDNLNTSTTIVADDSNNDLNTLITKNLSEHVFKCHRISTDAGDATSIRRPSLTYVANELSTVFGSSQVLTTDSAAILDKYFGNCAPSLLTIENSFKSKAHLDMVGLETQIEESLYDIVRKSDEACKIYKYDSKEKEAGENSLTSFYDSIYGNIIKSIIDSESTETFEYEFKENKKQEDTVNFWHLFQPKFFNSLLKNVGIVTESEETTLNNFYNYTEEIIKRELSVVTIAEEKEGKLIEKHYYKGFLPMENLSSMSFDSFAWNDLYIDNIPVSALDYAYMKVRYDLSALKRLLFNNRELFRSYLKDEDKDGDGIAEENKDPVVQKARAAVITYLQEEVIEDEDTLRSKVQRALLPLRDTWMSEVNTKLENPLTVFPLPISVFTLDDLDSVAGAQKTDNLFLIDSLDVTDPEKDWEALRENNLKLIQCMSYYLTAIGDSSYNLLLPFVDNERVENLAHEILRGNRAASDPEKRYALIKIEEDSPIKVLMPEIRYSEDFSDLIITWTDNPAEEVIKIKDGEAEITSVAFTSPDIVSSSLDSLVSYIIGNLEGVTEGPRGVKYLSTDKQAVGRKDSLYYRRYINLNSRMNKLQGPLSKIPLFSKGTEMSDITQMQNDQLAESYNDILSVIPILKMSPIQYLKTQAGTSTEIAINGKFYYKESLEAMKDMIGNNCVLTCGSCTVKDSCPFYNEEEVLNLYCNPATTLDLYVKDNELDLLVYDEESPRLVYKEDDKVVKTLILNDADLEPSSLNPNSITTIHNFHKPYAEIQKMSVDGNNTNITATTHQINNVVENLERKSNELDFNSNLDTTGWLLGGRYGTVEYNPGKNLKSAAYPEIVPPSYKFLYNTMFIPDEHSEVIYKSSINSYDVELDLYENGVKKHYTGTTKIKIPTTLKGLQGLPSDAQIYLASDDFKDSEGNDITPLIYLNTVGNLRYAFDLTDTGTEASVQSSADKTLYAKDVAQWGINIAKGACYDEPVTSNINRDQYWMSTIKKKVWDEEKQREKWITLPGRPRYKEGYQELVNDPEVMDPSRLIAGKPVVATYENFMRRISFGMYSSSGVDQGSWLIEWISPREQEALRDNIPALEKRKEIQRATLPLMKTNLRLVIVK